MKPGAWLANKATATGSRSGMGPTTWSVSILTGASTKRGGSPSGPIASSGGSTVTRNFPRPVGACTSGFAGSSQPSAIARGRSRSIRRGGTSPSPGTPCPDQYGRSPRARPPWTPCTTSFGRKSQTIRADPPAVPLFPWTIRMRRCWPTVASTWKTSRPCSIRERTSTGTSRPRTWLC